MEGAVVVDEVAVEPIVEQQSKKISSPM
jgi:hypothetical protein